MVNAWYYEFDEILECDDKERFLRFLSDHADTLPMSALGICAKHHARKCLLAMIEGDGCISAQQLYTKLEAHERCVVPRFPQFVGPGFPPYVVPTPLACVVQHFPEAYDIINLLLKQGPLEHANIKCSADLAVVSTQRCPLDHLFVFVSYMPHLKTWNPGNSLYKLIILLCQWETRSCLQSARLLAPHTDGLNDLAWTYVRDGRLASLAALLLVAKERVLVPFDSGLTIQQRIVDLVDALSSEDDLDIKGARYQSMLIEACKLLEIFERAGGVLSLYCSSTLEYVPIRKVLVDVTSVLTVAGCVVQPMDLDLRDCYSNREWPEVYNPSIFKLSSPRIPKNTHLLPSSLTPVKDYTFGTETLSLTPVKGFGASLYGYPFIGGCQLFHKLNSGRMLNLAPPSSTPRPFPAVNSGGPRKYLTYTASTLARRIKNVIPV